MSTLSEAAVRENSLCYDLFSYELNYYKAKAGVSTIGEMLEIPEEYKNSYHKSGSSFVLYKPMSDGSYVETESGDSGEYVRRTNSAGAFEYIHVSQVFQPTAAVRSAMGVVALVLSVTYQTVRAQLTHIENYLLEIEKYSGTLRNLQDAYQMCVLLQTNLESGNENAVAAVSGTVLSALNTAGVFGTDTDPKFITGIGVTQMTLYWKTYWTYWFSSRSADHSTNFGLKFSGEPARVVTTKGAGSSFTSEADVIKFLSAGVISGEFGVGCSYPDIIGAKGELWHNGSQIYNGGMPGGNNNPWDPLWKTTRDSTLELSFHPRDFAKEETLSTILAPDAPGRAFIPKRNLLSYMDYLRTTIENTASRSEIPAQGLARVNNDMTGTFSLATNLIKEVGTTLGNVNRNIRI